jgi:mannose-6-phosphate isomerase-like protein (cupin superfamily)
MPQKIDSPSIISTTGNKIKIIEEFIGRVNTNTASVSIARMTSPPGWAEAGQKPDFDEYSIVLKGMLRVESVNQDLYIHAGQAVITSAGEWVRYSTPGKEGAEYIAICLPAFSIDTVHRDKHS